MKLPLLQSHGGRRAFFFLRSLWPHSQSPTNNNNNIGTTEATNGVADSTGPTKPSSNQSVPAMWVLLHALFCAISMALGFRFSRLLLFLLFLPSAPRVPVILPSPLLSDTTTMTSTSTAPGSTSSTSSKLSIAIGGVHHGSNVYVGRHPIRVRPWPHPDPAELMRAHMIMDTVQRAQRRLSHGQAGLSRDILAVTPTFASATQAARLTSLAHTLRLVPGPVTWIVIEAGKKSDETAAFLVRSGVRFVHLGFGETNGVPPDNWARRRVLGSRMRVEALKEIREQRMDGIVVFLDESNTHRMELFDEVQKVKWMGAVPVGFLDHPEMGGNVGSVDIPVQGPACDESGQLFGFQAFDSMIYANRSRSFVADGKLEWAGFALSSQLLWKRLEDRPAWAYDLDAVDEKGGEIGSPLVLVNDASMVEPLGDCSNKALLWWLRSDDVSDTLFPPGWKIDLSLIQSVPTALPEALQNQSIAVGSDQDRD